MNDRTPSGLDRWVELLAKAMDAVGLNGRRLLWKWNRRQSTLGEAGARGEQMLRSAKGRHKMCPACRALIPRSEKSCPECGASLAGVSTPGPGRLLADLLPGISGATSLLLLVNALLFVLVLMTPEPGGASGGGGMGRMFVFSTNLLLRYGGGLGGLVTLDGEWFRLITPIFLHSGLIHFGFNSFVLLQLGPLAEEACGTPKFWVLYLFAGFSGNVLAQFLSPSPVVGASGAIVGLIGLMLAYGIRRGGIVGSNIKRAMMQYAFYILIFSLLPGISFLSHAGGFVGGFVAGLALPPGPPRTPKEARTWQLLALGCVLLVLYCFYQVAVHGMDFLRYVQ